MSAVNPLVDHLFRHEAGRITAALTRALGARHLELAEEATQEALTRALQTWPFRGVPAEPAAWLHTAARNYARDQLRRRANWQSKEPAVQQFLESRGAGGAAEAEMDDTLAMMLLCCHPAISAESRVALTLKTVSGFSTREIASAFLTTETAIAQRIVRAKRTIGEAGLEMELPEGVELPGRLDTVCDALYLLFNEGYFASHGATALRRELCEEAIRLLGCIAEAGYATPARWALAALFHLHLARFETRVGDDGRLVAFEEMRAVHDPAHMRLADEALREAMRAARLSVWHVEAAIAAAHCAAQRDWPHITKLYDALLEMKPSPIVRLNRAVAVFRAGRREEAFGELAALEKEEGLRGYSLLPATQARLHEEAGNSGEAKRHYQRALACAMSAPAREFLERRLAEAGN
ncbi:MAG: RNA polymerase subunit sigma-24 [Bryobacterales bacterium]|nr:RNA polymerase subunit sigma-24 [Bryobacterales bacterium]